MCHCLSCFVTSSSFAYFVSPFSFLLSPFLFLLVDSALGDALAWASYRARPSAHLERVDLDAALDAALDRAMQLGPGEDAGPATWIERYNFEVRRLARRASQPRLRVVVGALREFDGARSSGYDAPAPPPEWSAPRHLEQLRALVGAALLPPWPVDASARAAACATGDREHALRVAEESCCRWARTVDFGAGNDAARRGHAALLAPTALALLAELRQLLRHQATSACAPRERVRFDWRAVVLRIARRRNAFVAHHVERCFGASPTLFVLPETEAEAEAVEAAAAAERAAGVAAGGGDGEGARLVLVPPPSARKRLRRVEATGSDARLKRARGDAHASVERRAAPSAALSLSALLAAAQAERAEDVQLTAVCVRRVASPPRWERDGVSGGAASPALRSRAPSLDAALASATAATAATAATGTVGGAVDIEELMAQLFSERAQAARFDRALSATLVAESATAQFCGGASGAFASKEDEGM